MGQSSGIFTNLNFLRNTDISSFFRASKKDSKSEKSKILTSKYLTGPPRAMPALFIIQLKELFSFFKIFFISFLAFSISSLIVTSNFTGKNVSGYCFFSFSESSIFLTLPITEKFDFNNSSAIALPIPVLTPVTNTVS